MMSIIRSAAVPIHVPSVILTIAACATSDAPSPSTNAPQSSAVVSDSLRLKRHQGPDAGMALVPGGPFLRGEPGQTVESQPTGLIEPAWVHVDSFWIDRYEYPNVADSLPMATVTWYEAKALCEERGKRLCTADEWEKACRGPDAWFYPYGNEYEHHACHTPQDFDNETVAPSGSHSECRSGFGVYDMVGNINEWTADVVMLEEVRASPNRNNYGNDDFWHDETYPEWPIVMGGDWGTSSEQSRCTYRGHFHPPDHRLIDDGFRCCADDDPELESSITNGAKK